jgi:hypothetical protein
MREGPGAVWGSRGAGQTRVHVSALPTPFSPDLAGEVGREHVCVKSKKLHKKKANKSSRDRRVREHV